MGEPDSMTTDAVRRLALDALGPRGRVSAQNLREMGLHREFLQLHFQALQPEIKNLVGWKALGEYSFTPPWRDRSAEDLRRGTRLTDEWKGLLAEHGLADELAVRMYDGESRPAPAPDYRLFVLRDGRLLYYEGGFYARGVREKFSCADALTVLDVLDKNYSNTSCSSVSRQPFLVIINSLADAFKAAIADRERKVAAQKALEARLRAAIHQVSDK